MTEQDIQNKIRKELSPYGMVFRTNAGKFYQGKLVYSNEFKQMVLTNIRIVTGLPEGFSDLIHLGFDGHASFIECKTPTGKVKPEQQNFINQVKKYKYKAGVARSTADALKIIGRN